MICPKCQGTGLFPAPHRDGFDAAADLVKRMEIGNRNVYRSQRGNLCMTYGGGSVSESALSEALQRRLIRLKWADTPDYWELNS